MGFARKSSAYVNAVAFVALNDGPGDVEALDTEWVSGLTTVVLISAVWNVPADRVAADVVAVRIAEAGRS